MLFWKDLLVLLVLGFALATPYGWLTGFSARENWVVASLVLAGAFSLFLKSLEKIQEARNHEESIMGWGMFVSVSSALLVPIGLHLGGMVQVPSWLELYHRHRFLLGAVAAGLVMLWVAIVIRLNWDFKPHDV